MTKKEMNEIVLAITEVRNYMGNLKDIDEMISKIGKYLNIEGACFVAEFHEWHYNCRTQEESFDLNDFLSPQDQKPLIKSMIKALKEQREEYAMDLQKAEGRLKGLMKEALNE